MEPLTLAFLVLTYTAHGQSRQDRILFADDMCERTSAGIAQALKRRQAHHPRVDLNNGRNVRVTSARCVPVPAPDTCDEPPQTLMLLRESGDL